jgi:hypothetical protein
VRLSVAATIEVARLSRGGFPREPLLRGRISPAEPFLTKSNGGFPRSRPLSFRTARAGFSFERTFFPLSETRPTAHALVSRRGTGGGDVWERPTRSRCPTEPNAALRVWLTGEVGDFKRLTRSTSSPVLQKAGAFLLARHHQHLPVAPRPAAPERRAGGLATTHRARGRHDPTQLPSKKLSGLPTPVRCIHQ